VFGCTPVAATKRSHDKERSSPRTHRVTPDGSSCALRRRTLCIMFTPCFFSFFSAFSPTLVGSLGRSLSFPEIRIIVFRVGVELFVVSDWVDVGLLLVALRKERKLYFRFSINFGRKVLLDGDFGFCGDFALQPFTKVASWPAHSTPEGPPPATMMLDASRNREWKVSNAAMVFS